MSFSGYDAIIQALTTGLGQTNFLYKTGSATSIAGTWQTLWNVGGTPNAGSNPTGLAGAICDNTTLGCTPITGLVNGSNKLYVVSASGGGTTQGVLAYYDRLWHVGGCSMTSTSTQTLTGTTAPTRNSDGAGNMIAVEVTTANSTTGATLTIKYTNENGVTGRSATVAIPASTSAGRIFFASLQAGDKGVKSVQSVASGTALSAGAFNMFLFNDNLFITIPFMANQIIERDLVLQIANLPEIKPTACLATMVLASTTSTGAIYGKVTIVEG